MKSGKIVWQSPSNIALVKYWGKRDNQIPCNPSVSFTLKNALTTTEAVFEESSSFQFELFFEGHRNPKFEERVKKYLISLENDLPFLKNLKLTIDTKNSFPHSAGIASSASSFSSFALILNDLEEIFTYNKADLTRASYLSRLGSGSACRSLFGPVVSWGESSLEDSTDLFGSPVKNVSEVFKNFRDAIIVIDQGAKSVSSSMGHKLMNEHPFASHRYEQAQMHHKMALDYLSKGDVKGLGELMEREALMLHGLMLSSPSPFILMKPQSIEVINAVKEFREKNKIPVYFTLDAGPNIHLLYPQDVEKEVQQFIKNNFPKLHVLFDEVGMGPKRTLIEVME